MGKEIWREAEKVQNSQQLRCSCGIHLPISIFQTRQRRDVIGFGWVDPSVSLVGKFKLMSISPRKSLQKTNFFFFFEKQPGCICRVIFSPHENLADKLCGKANKQRGTYLSESGWQRMSFPHSEIKKSMAMMQGSKKVSGEGEKKTTAFCKSDGKKPMLCCLVIFLSNWTKKRKQCRRSPWRKFSFHWPFLVSSQK